LWGYFLVLASAMYSASESVAFAQVAPSPPVVPDQLNREAERIQEQEAERQRAREEAFRNTQVTPPSGTQITVPQPAEASGQQCVALTTVSISGLTLYKRDDFAKELDALIGPCTNIEAINNTLRSITNRYITDGYVTSRAIVGPQDLQDGSLEIAVLEGVLSKVLPSEDSFSKRAIDMAFPGLEGNVLNLRALEQGVDQLSRLPSAEPNIDITPASEQGASNVMITRKELGAFLRPSLSFNNDGSVSTGRILTNVGLDLDNIFGLADYWSIYATGALENDDFKGSKGFGGFVSVPYGFWTVSVSGGRFSYSSLLQGNGQSFSSTGRSINGSVVVDRMLYRDAKTKISVSGTLALLDTENRIQGIRLSTSSYRLVTGALDWRLQRKMGQGLLSASLGVTRGFDMLGANAADTGPDGPNLSFRSVDASLGYQQQFSVLGVPTNYSGILRAQSALDPVFSSQRFSLGGSSTVRGFRNDGISGRHGVFTRQQIEFPLLSMFKKSADHKSMLTSFIGYDAGAVIPRDNDRFERGFIQASTFGVRFRHKNVNAEVSASMPLSAPSFVRKSKTEISASIRLNY
jgi:hemolysin activation/secretion protein